MFFEWRDDPEHYDDRKNTHVIRPFPIPAGWKRYRSMDWGYSKPFSVLWWAVDPDDRVYLYREWYGASAPNEGLKLPVQEVAEGITAREAMDGKVIGYADPAIWGTETGESVAEMFAKAGVWFAKGDHDRMAGKMQLHNRLAFDENGIPMLYVFSNCREFIRTLPALVYSQTRVEDVDTDGEDHSYDAARYFLMTRPCGVKPKLEEKIISQYDPFDLYKPRRTDFLSM